MNLFSLNLVIFLAVGSLSRFKFSENHKSKTAGFTSPEVLHHVGFLNFSKLLKIIFEDRIWKILGEAAYKQLSGLLFCFFLLCRLSVDRELAVQLAVVNSVALL